MAIIPGNNGSPANPLDGLRGVVSGVAAGAGVVGEVIQSTSGTITAGASATNTNVTSITLTAGDWDVAATLLLFKTGTTAFLADPNQYAEFGVSLNSASFTGTAFGYTKIRFSCFNSAISASAPASGAIPKVIFNVSASTIIYLVGSASYTGTAPVWESSLVARRMR